MKKDVTLVPEDQCVLDILAELKERTANSWIYLHENLVEKLKKTCDNFKPYDDHLDILDKPLDLPDIPLMGSILLLWQATERYPSADVLVDLKDTGCWKPVTYIKADDIAFSIRVNDPVEIFFFK